MDTDVLSIKYQVSSSLKKIVKELIGQEVEPEVTVQTDLEKGDFSTNVAMVAFGRIPPSLKLRRTSKNQESRIKNYGSPMELAEEVIRILNTKYLIPNTFRLVEAKEPGFINFWLSQAQVIKQIERVLDFDKIQNDKSRELILEFGDLNPFKEPHIGHLRNLALGESIARLLQFCGVKVIRANYEGDVGMHVAKCLYGILQKSNLKNQISKIETESLEIRAKILGEAYAFGAQKFETDDKAKEEIISINNKIYNKDSEVLEIWKKGRQWSLDYFEILYKKLGIKYDKYYFESQTAVEGLKIVKENIGRVFEKDKDALIFRGENFGLHTRVFVTAKNFATYEGKDLGLAVLKNKNYPNADSIIMTANEQIDYFKVLLKALFMVDKKIADKTSHLTFGFVNLKEGKMSSRTGNVVPAFWLIDEIKKRLKKGFRQVSEEVLEQICIGAVKWAMLKFSRESNIAFSVDESIDLAGNSGPYMQYTYARIASLLSKSSKGDFEANSVKSLDPELVALARTICQFKFRVKSAAENFSPNILSNYLYTLAQNFNKYYEKEKIIGSDREEEKLAMVKAVGEVLRKGLYLLGIASPEKI